MLRLKNTNVCSTDGGWGLHDFATAVVLFKWHSFTQQVLDPDGKSEIGDTARLGLLGEVLGFGIAQKLLGDSCTAELRTADFLSVLLLVD